ncbi:MAG: hypothetical protein EPO28_10130 [Saprospiraceae bacterium]|nr:MAG: hypothetical protein EPO28_10130 [Saprospiraceae bacterium]
MNKAAFDGDAKRARGVLVNAFIVYQNETLPLLESSLQKAVAGGYTVEGAHHRHDMMEDLEKHERQLKRLKLAAFPLLKEAQPVVFW